MMPQTDEVSSIAKELDNFYELVNIRPSDTLPNGHSLTLETPMGKPLTNGHVLQSGTNESDDEIPVSSATLYQTDNMPTDGVTLVNGVPVESALSSNESVPSVRLKPDLITTDLSIHDHGGRWSGGMLVEV